MRTTADRTTLLIEVLGELHPDCSRTTLRQMLQAKRVRVNGELEVDAKRSLVAGDDVQVLSRAEAVTLPSSLTLLHEDDDVIVVIKANGLLTVATEREPEANAQAMLNEYLRQKSGGRIHVVHRLDRETSGVLVFAKNFKAREVLKEKFAAHDIDRIYVAIVEGTLSPPHGTIQSHLLEKPNLRMESVKRHPEAKLSITHYRTLATSGPYSMLEVTLETGRKNQIRAHLSEKGHPVVGDQFYGSKVNPLGRLGLHAQLLGFDHPATGRRMTFTAPMPKVFRHLFGTDLASGRATDR
ncbi:MAG TPA: RluA family pseudouridine synthase [Thermoanaerobaculia bacterium]|nr:RluA family pseudouridine synthase [Thermoanaerobaculia bacterium]